VHTTLFAVVKSVELSHCKCLSVCVLPLNNNEIDLLFVSLSLAHVCVCLCACLLARVCIELVYMFINDFIARAGHVDNECVCVCTVTCVLDL